jgi:hypothetical protein
VYAGAKLTALHGDDDLSGVPWLLLGFGAKTEPMGSLVLAAARLDARNISSDE